ncbi:MAG: peptidase, partial [Syntrophomonas sp.]
DNLSVILSSPKESSNPQDYINAHKNEYENFFKYGGEDALQYMLTQFEVGNAQGLRGQIMMKLCKELLGARNNVTNESLSPQEWYNALDIRQEIMLPNYEYDGQDPIEKLVYDTEIERDSTSNKRGGFIIVAPKVFGSYEEEDLLKVFVTTYSARYKLYGNTLSQEGGSIIPAAITYRKDGNGSYVLEKYEQARDGSEFGPSIREYCTMPVSGKEIKGLADKIFKHYTDYEDIRILLHDNLFKHLKKNGITDATLSNSKGEIKFSMSDPK